MNGPYAQIQPGNWVNSKMKLLQGIPYANFSPI